MKIGFIGLGLMGEPMALNILKKHDDKLYVFDYLKENVLKLTTEGAIEAKSNIELVDNVDMIISMIPTSKHVLELKDEIKPHLRKGQYWIDMSTIDPSVSLLIYEELKPMGVKFLDAPVVKSRPAAISGDLGILVGAEEEIYNEVKPILNYMGKNIIRMGDNSKGLVMKACHNCLVSEIQNGVNETLNLALKLGISVDDFATACSYGGAQNFYLDGQKEKLKVEDYTTAFSLQNMLKDLGIVSKLKDEVGFSMPGADNCKRVYEKGFELGYGKDDFRKTFKVVKDNK